MFFQFIFIYFLNIKYILDLALRCLPLQNPTRKHTLRELDQWVC